jgi:uncharacterized protein (DUF885 family)
MSRLLITGLVSCLLLGCQAVVPVSQPAPQSALAAAETMTASQRLNQWLDEQYEARLQMSPMAMTSQGRKDKYDQMDDVSEAAAERRLAWLAASVETLRAEFEYAALDDQAQLSFDLWVDEYERSRAAWEFRGSRYVFTQMMGVQSQLPNFLINFHRVDSAADMEAYIKRLSGVSHSIEVLLQQAQNLAATGVRPPRFAYAAVISEARNQIAGAPFDAGAEIAPLWQDAGNKVDQLLASNSIDKTTADRLRSAARDALLVDLKPAYAALADWLTADINNTSAVSQGVGSLPNGAAFYAHSLRARTSTDLTADQIHGIGLMEVARLRAEMTTLKNSLGFNGDLKAFFDYLRADDQFYYADTDAGRQAYITDTEAFYARIKVQLPDYFGLLPKAELVVKRVEAFREQDGAAQHYSRSTADGARPGVYYAHLSDMRAMPRYLMEAIAMHEGIPGHHMQIAIAQELTDLPKFRTMAFSTAFVEGWALYAELLAKEMGGYEDPYSDFGRMTSEIWRAVRLVVDSGLHAKGWSEDQAVAYFLDNSAVAETAARSEVQRYLVWPGQATAYKVGMLKILSLRREAEEALGDRFDIRAFHDVVLGGGALPLTLLERRVRHWINATAARSINIGTLPANL